MRLIYTAILITLITACATKSVPAPADLIAQEKFVDVMVDVRLLEGAYSARVAKPDTIKPYMNAYYNNLFTKHGISKEQFKTSYAYYLQQENTMV
jgi:Domain of unknown function (DUF4296)